MRSYTLCANRFKFITDLEPLFLAHPVHTNDTETANYAAYLCTHSSSPMVHIFYAWLAGERRKYESGPTNVGNTAFLSKCFQEPSLLGNHKN